MTCERCNEVIEGRCSMGCEVEATHCSECSMCNGYAYVCKPCEVCGRLIIPDNAPTWTFYRTCWPLVVDYRRAWRAYTAGLGGMPGFSGADAPEWDPAHVSKLVSVMVKKRVGSGMGIRV